MLINLFFCFLLNANLNKIEEILFNEIKQFKFYITFFNRLKIDAVPIRTCRVRPILEHDYVTASLPQVNLESNDFTYSQAFDTQDVSTDTETSMTIEPDIEPFIETSDPVKKSL